MIEAVVTTEADRFARRALAARLRSMPALVRLSPAATDALAEVAEMRTITSGAEMIAEGGRSASFYILLSGRMKISRTLANGRSVTLALLGPGDLFGAVAALSEQTCDAATVALERSSCLEVHRDALFDLFQERPSLVAELLPFLTRQLAECKNCIVELTCYRVETRFAQLLLKLGDSIGTPFSRGQGTFIPIRLSRQELADMTGTTIETAIRVMSRWGKDGVVETRKDGFLVRDRPGLERLAQA